MATTTKTLTPTNQTITLPDMTERPNASVLVDGIGKDADAINALSEQIVTLNERKSVPSNDFNALVVDTSGANAGQDKHYKGASISTMSNKPSNETIAYPFVLDVYKTETYNIQHLTVYQPGTGTRIYIRNQYYGTGTPWSNWEQLALNSKITPIYKTATVDNSSQCDSNTLNGLSSTGITSSQEIISARLNGDNSCIVLWFYYGERAVFKFVDAATMATKAVTGTLEVYYR